MKADSLVMDIIRAKMAGNNEAVDAAFQISAAPKLVLAVRYYQSIKSFLTSLILGSALISNGLYIGYH